MNELLRDEDDVLLNFSEGTVRVKRGYFFRARGPMLANVLHASLDRERSGVNRGP